MLMIKYQQQWLNGCIYAVYVCFDEAVNTDTIFFFFHYHRYYCVIHIPLKNSSRVKKKKGNRFENIEWTMSLLSFSSFFSVLALSLLFLVLITTLFTIIKYASINQDKCQMNYNMCIVYMGGWLVVLVCNMKQKSKCVCVCMKISLDNNKTLCEF